MLAPGRDRARFAVALLGLLLVACEPGPSATPATPADASPTLAAETSPAGSATPGESPGPEPGLVALGEDPPEPPVTSRGKIEAALADGSIDVPTSLLYRVYAAFGDPRLPSELAGEGSEDADVFDILREQLDDLPEEVRAEVLRYLVRPTDPTSTWNREPEVALGRVELARARLPGNEAAAPALALSCVDGWMRDRVSSTIPVLLSAHCGSSTSAAIVLLEEVRGYIRAHWLAMTNHMGPPMGDANDPDDTIPDLEDTGDGLVDIYLLSDRTPSGHPRDFGVIGYAHAIGTAPFEGPAGAERSSTYIVVGPGLSGLLLEGTVVHEFFHALQNAHNARGKLDCPPARLSSGCAPAEFTSHWFTEASATWAEHYFVPAARGVTDGPYYQWRQFIQTDDGISLKDGSNEYKSWMWPLFMQQEIGADAIGDTWRSLRAKRGWWEFQRTLDAQLSFADRFDDFAVRLYNEELLPGNPIDPRFGAPGLDPGFPTENPSGRRFNARVLADLLEPLVGPSRTQPYTTGLQSLASVYLPIEQTPGAHTLTFDFATFGPEFEVDAIVFNGDTWERRELPAGETVWCLDDPKDDIKIGWLIFSNHEQDPAPLRRPWSVTAKAQGCASSPRGQIRYSYLDTTPVPYAGSSSSHEATIDVKLKLNPSPGDPYAAMYLDDGTTYGIQVSNHSVLPPGVDGCSPVADAVGTPGGPLQVDSVVGNLYQDAGTWYLSIGVSLPVRYQTSESWCSLGSTSSTGDGSISLPDCSGEEDPNAATATERVFVFDCAFQGTSLGWGISGSVVIAR